MDEGTGRIQIWFTEPSSSVWIRVTHSSPPSDLLPSKAAMLPGNLGVFLWMATWVLDALASGIAQPPMFDSNRAGPKPSFSWPRSGDANSWSAASEAATAFFAFNKATGQRNWLKNYWGKRCLNWSQSTPQPHSNSLGPDIQPKMGGSLDAAEKEVRREVSRPVPHPL